MLISIINQARDRIRDSTMQRVVRTINDQVERDFAPYWGLPGTIRLEGSPSGRPRRATAAADARGDAVIYVWSHVDPDADGFHDRNRIGIPYGIVFVDMSDALNEPWSVTLSHEVLETLADPLANLYVLGPHPDDHRKRVFYWQEVCDAVQTQTYLINGVRVSNFVLPSYFCEAVPGMRNDFLGLCEPEPLEPFDVAPGGYMGYFDPHDGRTHEHAADEKAMKRLRVKQRAGKTRRAVRYAYSEKRSPTMARRRGDG